MSELRASSFTKEQYEQASTEGKDSRLVHFTIRNPHANGCVITLSGVFEKELSEGVLTALVKRYDGATATNKGPLNTAAERKRAEKQ